MGRPYRTPHLFAYGALPGNIFTILENLLGVALEVDNPLEFPASGSGLVTPYAGHARFQLMNRIINKKCNRLADRDFFFLRQDLQAFF